MSFTTGAAMPPEPLFEEVCFGVWCAGACVPVFAAVVPPAVPVPVAPAVPVGAPPAPVPPVVAPVPVAVITPAAERREVLLPLAAACFSAVAMFGRLMWRSPVLDWLPAGVGAVGVIGAGVVAVPELTGRFVDEESLTGVAGTDVATLAGVTVAGVTLKLPVLDAELAAGTAACVALEVPPEPTQRPKHSEVVVVLVVPGCRPWPSIVLAPLPVVDVALAGVPVVVVPVVVVPVPVVVVPVVVVVVPVVVVVVPVVVVAVVVVGVVVGVVGVVGVGVVVVPVVVVPVAVVVVAVGVVVVPVVVVAVGVVVVPLVVVAVGVVVVEVVVVAGVVVAAAAGVVAVVALTEDTGVSAATWAADLTAWCFGAIARTTCSGERCARAIPASLASSRASRT